MNISHYNIFTVKDALLHFGAVNISHYNIFTVKVALLHFGAVNTSHYNIFTVKVALLHFGAAIMGEGLDMKMGEGTQIPLKSLKLCKEIVSSKYF